MSGLEGLAAMAAAAQVAGYGCMIALAITEMTDRLRETPQRFERYTLKLNQLRTLAQQIQDNPNLRTPVVHSYLCATLQEAEATKHILDVFLTSSRKRRYWAVISGRPHRKIIDHLDSLHHTVTELNLCISSMNTIHLGQVQSGVDRLIVIAANNASLIPTAAVPYPEQSATLMSSSRSVKARRTIKKALKSKSLVESATKKAPKSKLLVVRATKKAPKSSKSSVKSATMSDGTFDHTKRSHTYENIRIEGNDMFTIGNIIGTNGSPGAGHKYLDYTIRDNHGLHIGNVGISQGHHYENGLITKNKASTLGDFNSLDARQADLERKREAMASNPQQAPEH